MTTLPTSRDEARRLLRIKVLDLVVESPGDLSRTDLVGALGTADMITCHADVAHSVEQLARNGDLKPGLFRQEPTDQGQLVYDARHNIKRKHPPRVEAPDVSRNRPARKVKVPQSLLDGVLGVVRKAQGAHTVRTIADLLKCPCPGVADAVTVLTKKRRVRLLGGTLYIVDEGPLPDDLKRKPKGAHSKKPETRRARPAGMSDSAPSQATSGPVAEAESSNDAEASVRARDGTPSTPTPTKSKSKSTMAGRWALPPHLRALDGKPSVATEVAIHLNADGSKTKEEVEAAISKVVERLAAKPPLKSVMEAVGARPARMTRPEAIVVDDYDDGNDNVEPLPTPEAAARRANIDNRLERLRAAKTSLELDLISVDAQIAALEAL